MGPSPPVGPPVEGLTTGDFKRALSLPNFFVSTRSCTRAALPASTLSSWAGTTTTRLVFVAEAARANAVPPLLRTKKTRVLPLPGMKPEPFTVSVSPTDTDSGLIDLITGGAVLAEAPAGTASRALESAPRQRTTRREFIAHTFRTG